jgi:DNA polymerase sigma
MRTPILFLKYFLAEKNLNNTYLGGLNAYGLSLLMIAFKEQRKMQKICLGEFLV